MNNEVKYPKLPKMWKHQFLNALRNKCYRFVRQTWVRSLTQDEIENTIEKDGQIHEYGYCVLGAAYHFSTGKNLGSAGFEDPKVPEAFKHSGVRSMVMGINDASHSYTRVADWIEEHL